MPKGRPSKKQHILDTAQQLFAERGYQGTSIDLVVREASVSKPTVYNNFPSKQALLQSLITRQLDIIEARQQSLLANTLSTSDKLYTLFQQIIDQPFELALYKIYYGERYKLDSDTLQLFTVMDEKTEFNCTAILKASPHSDAQISASIALYKNTILINALVGRNSPKSCELKVQIRVLGLISEKS